MVEAKAIAPISLYFGVDKGRHADLETIARASLEWANLVRDIAAVVAPELEFEIEFVESEEGSVWLSNMLRAIHEGDRKALGSIVLAVLTFFAMGPALHLQADLGDWLFEQFGHEHKVKLTEEDKQELIEKVRQAVAETQIEERRRNIVTIAEQDQEVTSIGVDFRSRRAGPRTIISREQFPSYDAPPPIAAAAELYEEDVLLERNLDVVIVRASLKEGVKNPRWRFRQGEEEWSAKIEDQEFIWALNNQRTGIPLAVGQHMRVDVAIDLKQVEGEWEEKQRRIVRVREPKVPRVQTELGFGGQ